jgi:Kdo2-lipid IVA lauroyltransferase/acyltransferase
VSPAAHLLRLLAVPFGAVSWRTAQRWGAAIGALGWHLAPRDRKRALEHLAIAFPELTPEARRRIARDCFRHLGTSGGEALHLLRRGAGGLADHVRVEGFEHFERLRREGRPAVLVSAHCGNWELVHAGLNARGLDMPVVVRRLDEPGLDALVAAFRQRVGTPTIVRGAPGAARGLLRALRGGGVVGLMVDQDTRVDGVWVPFFGRPAYTPSGPAEMSRRFDAPAVPTFAERLADGSHVVRVHEPIELPADVSEATAILTARVEDEVRRVPAQWAWIHRRWRRQPPAA